MHASVHTNLSRIFSCLKLEKKHSHTLYNYIPNFNLLVEIKVLQAILSDTIFEAVVRLPYDIHTKHTYCVDISATI